ncbi:MAG: hypothetical protein IK065_04035, partial [Neisseriaceae bacterium]|nr:hypothetical protein [Neisseriaceae bacterium]
MKYLNEHHYTGKLTAIGDSIISKLGLNPKTLASIALRSFGAQVLLTAEFYAIESLAEYLFDKAGLYDNETYISLSDKIFRTIDGVTITDPLEFDAVSSVYSLLQANARNTLNEADWKQLFGADEIRKMDMDKVKNVLKQSIRLITGKEIEINTTEDMIKAVQENYKAFKDVRGFSLLLTDRETLWKAVTSKELYEYSDLGLAHRYSLKNLNNFLITSNENSNEKVSIYSKHNQNGELDMYSPDNKNGMTVEYIQDRAKMLWFKIEYDSQNLSYDKRLNEGLLPFPVRGNLQFVDNDSNITLDIDGLGINERKYFRFGDTGDDNLTGGGLQDKLYGGLGNDTLDGGKGGDYLEGGIGYDTYYIDGGADIVFDADGEGKLLFGNIKQAVTIDEMYKIDEIKDDKYGFITTIYKSKNNQFKAEQKSYSDNLTVYYQGNRVDIRDYFLIANKMGNGGYEKLGITLKQAKETQDPPDFPTKDDSNPDNPIEPTEIYAQAKYNQATIYANVAVKYYGRQTGWDGLGIDNGGDYLSAASAKQLYAQMSKYGDKVTG